MNLKELISHSPLVSFLPCCEGKDPDIIGLTMDSRQVEAGWLYSAIKGTSSDGHQFIPAAIEAGAKVILCSHPPQDIPADVAIIISQDVRRATSQLAAHFYGNPSDKLAVLGVTGTNGKTTTAFIMDSLVRSKFGRCGLVGTVSVDEGKGPKIATHTTPDAITLQASLARMVENGCMGVAIEISSHGIEQGRTADMLVNTAVFTNLTQDHLDYHGTMDAYYLAKKGLFTQLGNQDPESRPCAIINIDDPYGVRLSRELKEEFPKLKQLTFGFGIEANFRAQDILQGGKGIEFRLDYNGKSHRVKSPMIGLFNVKNILGALASAVASKLMTMREAVAALEGAKQVPGRLERVSSSNASYHVFVDYAHTPDAVGNVCHTLKDLDPFRLITVFGCGGDRDRAKRPLMAAEASKYSNICIVTSDNPRTEDPIQIIKETEKGLSGDNHLSIPDRGKAIQHAINLAKDGDVVLIAGKGHEDYQIFGTEKTYFDDRYQARDAIMAKKKAKEIKEAEESNEKPFKRDDKFT